MPDDVGLEVAVPGLRRDLEGSLVAREGAGRVLVDVVQQDTPVVLGPAALLLVAALNRRAVAGLGDGAVVGAGVALEQQAAVGQSRREQVRGRRSGIERRDRLLGLLMTLDLEEPAVDGDLRAQLGLGVRAQDGERGVPLPEQLQASGHVGVIS